jgi:hypothetical protein
MIMRATDGLVMRQHSREVCAHAGAWLQVYITAADDAAVDALSADP